MFRAAVTFLVALPLLMPPGMCICQFARLSRSHPSSLSFGMPPAGTPTRAGCGQCSCFARSENHVHVEDDRPDADLDSCPQPVSRHEPGCPAVNTVDWSKIGSSITTVDVQPAPTGSVPLSDLVAASPAFSRLGHAAPASRDHIYITFRTLLI